MPFKVLCESCQTRLSVRDELAGKQVRCPKCQQAIRIPSAAAPASKPKPASTAPSAPIAGRPPKSKPRQPAVPSATPKSSFDEAYEEEDDAFNFGSDDQDFPGQDDDEFDPYGGSEAPRSLPPAKRASARSARPEETPAKSQGGKEWLLAAGCGVGGLLLGGLLGGVFFSGSSDAASAIDSTAHQAVTASPNQPGLEAGSNLSAQPASSAAGSGSDSSLVTTPAVLPPPSPQLTAEQLAGAADVRQVLAKMKDLLTSENDREFLIHYGPIDELRSLQAAEANSQPLPEIPRQNLLNAIDALEAQVADVGATAVVATLTADSGSGESDAGPGYEGDVNAVINRWISDLEEGNVREFMLNAFPPDALSAMFRNGPDRNFAAMADKDAALVVRMLQDLKSLSTETPRIDGDTAEFTLPAVTYTENELRFVRPPGNPYVIPERIIRFSRIGGCWRFYSDGSLQQTSVLDGKVIRLNLERVGSSWRLVSYPRL
ncbi:MAG: hypothetical protein R3C20_21320 [Planctomycetaceae bacterium]